MSVQPSSRARRELPEILLGRQITLERFGLEPGLQLGDRLFLTRTLDLQLAVAGLGPLEECLEPRDRFQQGDGQVLQLVR